MIILCTFLFSGICDSECFKHALSPQSKMVGCGFHSKAFSLCLCHWSRRGAVDELATCTLGSKVTWRGFGVLKAFRLSSERLLDFWRGWRVPFTWETKRLHDSEKQSSCLNFTFTTTMTWTSETFTDSDYSKRYRQCIQFSIESFLNAHKSQ